MLVLNLFANAIVGSLSYEYFLKQNMVADLSHVVFSLLGLKMQKHKGMIILCVSAFLVHYFTHLWLRHL
jgi:hypothetical protein